MRLKITITYNDMALKKTSKLKVIKKQLKSRKKKAKCCELDYDSKDRSTRGPVINFKLIQSLPKLNI